MILFYFINFTSHFDWDTTESIITSEDGTPTTNALKGNDFFGEEILKGGSEKTYLSTVTATTKCTCLMLQKSDVKRVMGSKRKGGTNMA